VATEIQAEERVNFLWTGGWDSTFQLLSLLALQKRVVTVYYLIDENRKSTMAEMHAMRQIRDRILERWPDLYDAFGSVRYFSVSRVAADDEITKAYQTIKRETHVGSQYEWLARFCREHKIKDMQLSVEAVNERKNGFFYIQDFVSGQVDGTELVWRISPDFYGSPEYALFQNFSFPLIRVTKSETYELVKQHGWNDIMEMTWFCHSPVRFSVFQGNRIFPCGHCNPCKIALREGFGWRIPVAGRFLGRVQRFLKAVGKK
jgi:7-cyano-7-deazaguanine synthase in queuosine biosynthesis